MKAEPIFVPVLLWFPSPSHCLLCTVFSLRGSHCAPQYAQISIQDAFYMLQLASFLSPTAGRVPGFYHAHSENNILKKKGR